MKLYGVEIESNIPMSGNIMSKNTILLQLLTVKRTFMSGHECVYVCVGVK